MRHDRKDCRIEAFEMARLKDALVLCGERDKFVSLRGGRSQRLFDKQIQTSAQQSRCYAVVVHGGYSNARCLYAKIGPPQLLNRIEDRDGKPRGSFSSARRVWLDGSNKSHTRAGSLKFAIDTKMIPAERTGADNGNAQIAFACDCYAP